MSTDSACSRVLLVDDHELIRRGLRYALSRDDDFHVVGEAAGVAAALEAAESLRPDVVIVDVRLPDGDGFDLTRRLRQAYPDVGIVIVTMHTGDDDLLRALDSGASAFVSKSAPVSEVAAAARYAATTPNAFTATDLGGVLERRLRPDKTRITEREDQVLQMLADGMTVPSVCRTLVMSQSTVKKHITSLYEKLGARSRSQALMTASQLGLVNRDILVETIADQRR
jgi:DNA-binding NarL/FixJ family response regulator